MESKTPLIGEALEQAVKTIDNGWTVLPGKGLVRIIETSGFKEGFGLVSRIAKLAEQQNHHPELTLRYSEVEIALTTHEAGGVTDKDIEMASAIDSLVS